MKAFVGVSVLIFLSSFGYSHADQATDYIHLLERRNSDVLIQRISRNEALNVMATFKGSQLKSDQKLTNRDHLAEIKIDEARWIAKVIDILQRRIDPKFDLHDRPFIHIAPPLETGLPSGADPASISDPLLRKQYEDSIKTNEIRKQTFVLQYKKIDDLNVLENRSIEYLSMLYGSSEKEINQLGQILASSNMDPKLAKEIVYKIRVSQTPASTDKR